VLLLHTPRVFFSPGNSRTSKDLGAVAVIFWSFIKFQAKADQRVFLFLYFYLCILCEVNIKTVQGHRCRLLALFAEKSFFGARLVGLSIKSPLRFFPDPLSIYPSLFTSYKFSCINLFRLSHICIWHANFAQIPEIHNIYRLHAENQVSHKLGKFWATHICQGV